MRNIPLSQLIEDKEQVILDVLDDEEYISRKNITLFQLGKLIARHSAMFEEDAVWFLKTLNILLTHSLLDEKRINFKKNFTLRPIIRPAQAYYRDASYPTPEGKEEDDFDESQQGSFVLKPARHAISLRPSHALYDALVQKPLPEDFGKKGDTT